MEKNKLAKGDYIIHPAQLSRDPLGLEHPAQLSRDPLGLGQENLLGQSLHELYNIKFLLICIEQ